MTSAEPLADKLPRDWSIIRSAIASTLSMKIWVQIWLVFLHAAFLAALFFMDRPSAQWILLGWAVSVPLIAVFIIVQRGLTRLLAVAHLIPWLPLWGYLVLRLSSDVAGPRVAFSADPVYASYMTILVVTLGVCLTFDLIDMTRWIRGERYVMGSRLAAKVDASELAPGLGEEMK